MNESNESKSQIDVFGKPWENPIAKGIERVLNSISDAINRGEFSHVFLTLGGGLGLGIIITALRGGKVSFLYGLVKLEQIRPPLS